MRPRMLNRLPGHSYLCTHAERLARVRIAIELREMAAGYVDANAVSRQKNIASPNQIDRELISLAGLEQLWSRALSRYRARIMPSHMLMARQERRDVAMTQP